MLFQLRLTAPDREFLTAGTACEATFDGDAFSVTAPMMELEGGADGPRKRRRINPPETEPYVLQELVADVPVATENSDQQVHITCVETWNENLYVGTSAGEVLHFVSLPGESSDDAAEQSSYILASRLPIASTTQSTLDSTAPTGIQQILVLPSAGKACILCNGVVTFYSLPELSPTYGTTKVSNCNWIGGLDLNASTESDEDGEDPVIMVAVNNKIMLVRIGEEPRVRNIEYPGCLVGTRRDTIACVANAHSYSLLEVEQRQKIPLFPISSSEESFESGRVEDMPSRVNTPERPGASSGNLGALPDSRGHSRSASLNTLGGTGQRAQSPRPRSQTPDPPTAGSTAPDSQLSGKNTPSRETTPQPAVHKPLPPPPKPVSKLKPHIVSPTPGEFLLVTGTEESDPGVGVFVNLDGEVAVRGTLQFQSYPKGIVVDSGNEDVPSEEQEGYVLALVSNEQDERVIEVQRWDIDPGEGERPKAAVSIPTGGTPVGIHRTVSASQMEFAEVSRLMQMVRLKLSPPPTPPERSTDPRTRASIEQFQKERELFDSQETDSDTSRRATSNRTRSDLEAERNREEQRFAKNLGKVKSGIALWSGNRIWRVVRNPQALQLESILQTAQSKPATEGRCGIDRDVLSGLVHNFEGMVPKTETEFLGLRYVKQKASLLLFTDLVSLDIASQTPEAIKATEEALIVGELDPRLVLLLIPLLKDEVIQGSRGIWFYGGLAEIVESLLESDTQLFNFGDGVQHMLARYLLSWRKKRGYGSVTNDEYLFNSVDAALLHLFLELDAQRPAEQEASTGSELNKLVDHWKGDFGRAVQLLESYERLFVLSRLHQSRKMAKHVLGTWRRIIEGERDAGGELSVAGAEAQVRKYLARIRDTQLVEEYGSWLAARNPSLGVEVFADNDSRVIFDTSHVVALLKDRAPGAVQYYLEHLVFTKNHPEYADDLIGYYLDTVLSVLESSPDARSVLAETYTTYRALQPPKPSYLNFVTENAPSEPWWQSRLRLLQLLGGGGPRSQYTSAPELKDLTYSIPKVLARIEPFKDELVSESIILGGRQGRHHEALRLLTHGLGDYDTAIRYCIFGGPSSTLPTGSQPENDQREALFAHLLHEFLQIADPTDRVERTSDLLARFAPLFDVRDVLTSIPDEWSVDVLSGFLVRVLRGLVSESREATVQRALSAGLNLRIGAEFVNETEKVGGWVEDDEGVRELRDTEAN